MKAGPVIGPFVFSFYMLQSVFQYFKGKCSGKEVATGEIKIQELTEKAPVKIEQESQKCPVKRRRSEEQLEDIKTKKQRKSISLYNLQAIKMIGEGAFGKIILQDPYDACVDWWALGVMVFTMLTGMMPFDAESEDELFDLIVYDYPQKPDKKTMSELSIDATELFLHLLEKYPQDRLGYKGGDYPWIRGHAFFHGFDWNRLEALELDRPP
ncbi:unnamed protein product [Porites lobata]|uniref:Protein kinase domain-containing protein n=1 Tax=Porites lobata TaxID=104759 RepID=A0ABN8SEX4_9CNID|nr:unnamed protein product [Porites lobata]